MGNTVVVPLALVGFIAYTLTDKGNIGRIVLKIMGKPDVQFTHKLDAAGIDLASDTLIDFFKDKIDIQKLTRVRLSIEESLGIWCSQAEEDDQFELIITKSLNGYDIKILADGPVLDPYTQKEGNEGNDFSNRLLVELGLVPKYFREGEKNGLAFRMRRNPMNPIAKILCVIAGAVLLGLGMTALLPASTVTAFNEGFLTPLYSAFFRLLGTIAGPMIFLSVSWGIYGIGDAITLGRIGKRLFAIFIAVNAFAAVFSIVGYPLLGPALTTGSSMTSGFSAIFGMLLDIIPPNIVAPFANGNTLQIIFMAIIIGIALLYLGRRTATVVICLEQINYLVQYLMKFIAGTVPIITFLVVLNLVISGTFSVIADSWKLLVVTIPVLFMATILVFIWAGIVLKVSPVKLMKKSFQLFLLGLSTASSSACFDTCIKTTKEKMGVDESLAAFGVPLGTVISRIGAVVFFQLICYFFAKTYNIQMSVQKIIILTITCVFLTVSLPPIPGGAAAGYVALLAAANIPNEALATALSLNVIMDFFICAFDIGVIPVILAVLAKRIGKLNPDVLKA